MKLKFKRSCGCMIDESEVFDHTIECEKVHLVPYGYNSIGGINYVPLCGRDAYKIKNKRTVWLDVATGTYHLQSNDVNVDLICELCLDIATSSFKYAKMMEK
jgi:hypothetical protein